MPLDISKGKQLYVVWQVAGLVRGRHLEFSAREIRAFKTEIMPPFTYTGIGFACSLDELTLSLEGAASFTRDAAPVEFPLQHFPPGRFILDLVCGEVPAIPPQGETNVMSFFDFM